MGWANDAVAALRDEQTVVVQPRGGSIRGRIEDSQKVEISRIKPEDVVSDDVVFIRWKSGYLLHLVLEVEPQRVRIGNTLGKVNGWAPRSDILGIVSRIFPRED
jgi:hypothetical protein